MEGVNKAIPTDYHGPKTLSDITIEQCVEYQDLIDAGFIGTITVELKNENSFPIMLTPGMRIGQVSFESLNDAAVKPSGMVGHYQNAPQPAVGV